MYGNTNSLIHSLTKGYLGCSQFVTKDYFFLPTSCPTFKIVFLLAYLSSSVSPISSFHTCINVRSSPGTCATYHCSSLKKVLSKGWGIWSSFHSFLEFKIEFIQCRSWAPPQLIWVHVYYNDVMSRAEHFTAYLPIFWLLILFITFLQYSLSPGVWLLKHVPFVGEDSVPYYQHFGHYKSLQ